MTTRSDTVRELTEAELLARIQKHLPPSPPWMLVGIGDDAAVVEPERNRVEVLTVDALIEGVHFDRAFVPPDAIGHRALAANLSDLAAMGASPRLALLSLALPPALPLVDFDGIVGGFAALAARHRLHLSGGNLTRSPGPLMIDITLVGAVKRRQALTRRGARPGDELFVSGTIGAAGAGLRMLRESLIPGAAPRHTASHSGGPATPDRCVERYLRPEPRVRLGVLLARTRTASACMDLSDGLSDAVHQVAAASGVGATIDADALPIDQPTRDWFSREGADVVTEAITAGDDYELLWAVRPRSGRRLAAVAARAGVPVTRIGLCTEDPAVVIQCGRDNGPTRRPLPRAGYAHFR